MKIINSDYGGFVASKNIVDGKLIRYSFREKSSVPQLNGWNFYSSEDDDEYINNPKNFVVLNAESLYKISPVILEIFDAPYGTDLCWLYEEGIHVGFYDLKVEKEVSIEQVLNL